MQAGHGIHSYHIVPQKPTANWRQGLQGKGRFHGNKSITDSLQPSGFGLDPMAMGQWPSTPLQIQQANGGISSNRHCKTKASDVNTFRLHLYHLSCKN
jgi:hypothetical protein